MEAMWIRFLPGFAAFMDAVRSGVIGEPRWLQASFCFAQPPDPRSPRFDPKLGGGALLDVGVYPLALSRALFGDPRELQVTARKDASPVELEVHALLSYTNGCTAMLAAAIGLKTPCEALLCGTHGMIRVDEPWPFFRRMSVWQYENASDLDAGRALRPWQNLTRLAARLPTDPLAAASCICRQAGMLLRRKQAVARLIGHRGNPYRFELEHTTRCIQQRHTESPMWPHDDTLGLMRLLDRVRTAASRPMIAPQPSD
jgi:predicted dehydrogenase